MREWDNIFSFISISNFKISAANHSILGYAEIGLDSAFILTCQQDNSNVLYAVSPRNVAQYTYHRDAFGLNTDNKRFARLFFQLLVYWAWKCTSSKKGSCRE